MWLFLATEVLLFGGLFVGFGFMQCGSPAGFFEAHHHLDKSARRAEHDGAAGLQLHHGDGGARGASTNKRKTADRLSADRLSLCAAIFLVREVLRVLRTSSMTGCCRARSIYASRRCRYRNQFIFFSFYFMMTGLHGIHVLGRHGRHHVGLLQARDTRRFRRDYYTPVDLVGLYWHLVDLIWIYLFPLLYLIT